MSSKQQTEKHIPPHFTLYIDGRLFNHKTKRFRKWTKDTNGYMKLSLWIDGKCKNYLQHRLLAEYFIPNHLMKEQVNHKNGIKHDNRIDNLEWVTPSENTRHSYANGLQIGKGVCKKVVDIYTNKVFKSVTEAAINYGICRGHLSNMLNERVNNNTTLRYYGKE